MVAWLFLACLFVANTAFNNLGFPFLTMAFNWGRATLGTIPFVTFGARYGGVKGGLIGVALGCALFGLAAVARRLCGHGAPVGKGRRRWSWKRQAVTLGLHLHCRAGPPI